jgi:uncharacterized protein YbjT (DUF2867 family)
VTATLLERGVRVRAFVHRIDDRAEHLRAVGAEGIEGDFLDIQSVQRAVRGVSSIYFASSPSPLVMLGSHASSNGPPEWTLNFCGARR